MNDQPLLEKIEKIKKEIKSKTKITPKNFALLVFCEAFDTEEKIKTFSDKMWAFLEGFDKGWEAKESDVLRTIKEIEDLKDFSKAYGKSSICDNSRFNEGYLLALNQVLRLLKGGST